MARVSIDNYTLGMAELTFSEDTSVAQDYSSHATWSIGNIVNASIAPEITYLDHYYVTAGTRKKDRSLITNRALAINFTFDEITAGSMKEWLLSCASGTITSGAGYEVYPMAKGEIKGCAKLTFDSAFGRNYIWSIPCAAFKPDGTFDYNAEDWMTAKGILECLVDSTAGTTNDVNKPFGTIAFSEAATHETLV
jgi:hypothetical protein